MTAVVSEESSNVRKGRDEVRRVGRNVQRRMIGFGLSDLHNLRYIKDTTGKT